MPTRVADTYTDSPSSLIIYPSPKPSADAGPKPNNLRAGLPQLEVVTIVVLSNAQPGSVNIAGNDAFGDVGDEGRDDVPSAGDLISRCKRQ